MAQRTRSIGVWLQQRLDAEPPRSKSLIVTIFGDSIAPFADGIWLGKLVHLLEPFGVNERLVRTSGFRLAEEGWLRPERQGRRSRYRLTRAGQQRIQHASHRIYDAPPDGWDGKWTLLMLRRSQSLAAERMQLRRELAWEGFGMLASGIFVHPCANRDSVGEVLERLGVSDSIVWLQASEADSGASGSSANLVDDCWRLDLVRANYAAFVKDFHPVLGLLSRGLDAQRAFVLQTLLIHTFRRVVLHDPRLPRPLLPENWPGHEAYELCRAIYLQTYEAAGAFLAEHVEGVDAVKKYPAEFMSRFGGLKK